MGSVSSVASYRRIIGLPGSDDRSELLSGTINGLFWVGVMAGTLLVGKLADYAGRRKAIVIACILGVVIVPILTALQNYAWALVARILNGVAAGALDSACLTWSAETAHHKSRGRTIGLELACSAYGAGMTLFAIYGLSRVYGDSSIVWRLPIALQIPLMFIIVAMVPFLPESPRWLVKVGLIQDARNVVAHMHPRGVEGAADIDGEGGKEDRQRQAVDAYIASIQQALLEERLSTESMGYLGMLVDTGRAKMARRTWSTLFIQFAAQFMMGGGIVSAIGMGIFETGGWPTSTSTLMAGCTFLTVASFGIFGASVLAETVGRRRSLWIGPLVGTVLLALMGMAAYYVNHYIVLSPAETKKYAIVVAALQFLWGANFGATWSKSPSPPSLCD